MAIPPRNINEENLLRQLWRPEMQCWVNSIEFNYNNFRGFVHCPANSYPDMRGTIGFFQKIDFRVMEIYITNEAVLDTVYRKNGNAWDTIHYEPRSKGRR